MKTLIGMFLGLGFFTPIFAHAYMGYGYGMMDSNVSGFMILTWAVWFTVGVLAIVWLWQQITKK